MGFINQLITGRVHIVFTNDLPMNMVMLYSYVELPEVLSHLFVNSYIVACIKQGRGALL